MALLVGVIAAMLGIGGGVFIVPALQLLPLSIEFSPQLAAGTSLTMILFKALSSTSGYARQRRIDYRAGLLLATATIPGAFLGARLTALIAEELLVLVFALFLFYVAFQMIFPDSLSGFRSLGNRNIRRLRRITDSDGKVFEYAANMKYGLAFSFLVGVSSGLFGVGGGTLMVPILHLALAFPIHVAVATSVFIMVFTSISGVATHLYLGNVQFLHAVVLGIGAVLGAQIGAHLSKRVSSENLRRAFGFVLVVVSLRMILKFLGGT